MSEHLTSQDRDIALRSAFKQDRWSPAPPGALGDWERELQSPFVLRAALSEDGDLVTWSVLVACPEAQALLEALGADDAAAFVSAAPPAVVRVSTAHDIGQLVATIGLAAGQVAGSGSSVEAFIATVNADPELADEARVVIPAVYAVLGRSEDAHAAAAGAPPAFRVALDRWIADGTVPKPREIAPETVIEIPWRRVSPVALWRVWRASKRSS